MGRGKASSQVAEIVPAKAREQGRRWPGSQCGVHGRKCRCGDWKKRQIIRGLDVSGREGGSVLE